MRRAPPRVRRRAVDAERRRTGVQTQVVADRGAADARAQQQRGGLQRAGGDDHARGADGERTRPGAVRGNPRRLDARRAAALDEHALRRRPDQDVGARVEGVLQVGLQRALLGARLVAEAQVAGGVGGVRGGVRVAKARAEGEAERVGALLHLLRRPVEVRAVGVGADAVHHRVEVTVVLGRVEPGEPVRGPLLADPVGRAQAVGPVDRRAAAQRGAGLQRDVQVRRRRRAATPVSLLVGGQLELEEVRLVLVGTGLEDDDPLAGLRQRAGDDAAAGTRADDHHVGLDRLGLAGRLVRRDRLRPDGRRGEGTAVAEGGPVGVLARGRIRHPVVEEEHDGLQRADARGDLRPEQRHRAQRLLARRLRHPLEALRRDGVEQQAEALALQLGHAVEDQLEGAVDPDVGCTTPPEPVGVVGARDGRDDRVADGAQHRPTGIGEGHG